MVLVLVDLQLISTFSQLNKWAIDNLMTHICALALILDNYEIDSFDLREDLGIEHSV